MSGRETLVGSTLRQIRGELAMTQEAVDRLLKLLRNHTAVDMLQNAAQNMSTQEKFHHPTHSRKSPPMSLELGNAHALQLPGEVTSTSI